MGKIKLYKRFTRKILEAKSSKQLIKLSNEIQKTLEEKTKYVQEYDTNVKEYISLYKKISIEVEKINKFFSKVCKFLHTKEGFIFKENYFDLKFKSKIDENNYVLKYKKLLIPFDKLLKLSSKISKSNPLFMYLYYDLEPREDLNIKYNLDLNCYKEPTFYGGGIIRSFPMMTYDKNEKRSYSFDTFTSNIKENARRFYSRLDNEIEGMWGENLYRELNKWSISIINDGVYSFDLTDKCHEKGILEENLLRNKKETEDKLRQIQLILRRKTKSKEKTENIGYVYVLSNEAYPNIYKIGSTYGLPEERAEELTGTGHLTPFKVKAKFKTQSAEFYEKITHKILHKYRVKQGREFFKLELEKIKNCLTQMLEITDNGKNKKTFDQLNRKIKI